MAKETGGGVAAEIFGSDVIWTQAQVRIKMRAREGKSQSQRLSR
jgi:hypothetical protein